MERAEAIKKIRQMSLPKEIMEILEALASELKESREEQIRKAIIKSLDLPFMEALIDGTDVTYEEAVAWLEKQKEQKPAEWDELQSEFKNINEAFEDGKKEVVAHPERYGLCKPAEWSEEDENMLIGIIERGNSEIPKGECGLTPNQVAWLETRLKSLRPQQKVEWSEEDSKRYVSIGTTLETSVVLSKEEYDANVMWLRDLVNAKKYSSPKPSWKPSMEQMKALEVAGKTFASFKDLNMNTQRAWKIFHEPLESLGNDLAKLMR